MKYLKCVVLAIILLLFKQSFSQVTIQANLKGLKAGTWVYYGLKDSFKKQKDSLQAKQDGFSLTLPVSKEAADFYTFRVGPKLSNKFNTTEVFLAPGKITIYSSSPDFEQVEFSGSDFAQQQNEMLNKFMRPIMDSIKAGNKQAGLGTVTVIFSHWLDWAKKHPNTPYSTALVSTIANANARFPFISEDSLLSVYKQLTPEAKANNKGKMLDQSMQIMEIQKIAGVGKTANDFSLPDALDKTVSLKDYKGKYVLLDFWASWCGPCKASFPFLKELYQRFKGDQFEIISISIDAKKEDWLKELKNQKLPWVTLWDKGGENVAMLKYVAISIPQTFLIDPNGKIIDKETGMDSSDNNPILKKLTKALGK